MGERLDAAVKAWREVPEEHRLPARAHVMRMVLELRRGELREALLACRSEEEADTWWRSRRDAYRKLLALLDAAEEETP